MILLFVFLYFQLSFSQTELYVKSSDRLHSGLRQAFIIEVATSPYPSGSREGGLNQIHAKRFATRISYLRMRSLVRMMGEYLLMDPVLDETRSFLEGVMILKPLYEDHFVQVRLVYSLLLHSDRLDQLEEFCQNQDITLYYMKRPEESWSHPEAILKEKHWQVIDRYYRHLPSED